MSSLRTRLKKIANKIFMLPPKLQDPLEQDVDGVPLYIRFMGSIIPVLYWDDETNLAKGEIEKFNFVESCRNRHKFNDQVVGSRDGYDMIWRHIHNDYFKLIGKSHERTC